MAGNDISFVARLKDDVSGKLGKIRDDFDRLGKSKGAQSLLQGLGMGAGLRMFTSIEGAISGVVDIAQDAIKNASDLRESMALSSQVFEASAESIDKWADTASDAFGMTKREALDTSAQFGNAFKNVGVSIDETAEKSQVLTRLAADLGSAFNRSSAEAANALRAGLLGEAEPMRRFGVFLDSVSVEAYLLANGVKKIGGEFTTSQKVMARYALIMKDTADTQGMFGRDTGSLADAQKSLEAQLTDVSAKLGTELLPLMVEWTTFLKDTVVPVLKEDLFPALMDSIQAFKDLATAIDLSSDVDAPDRLETLATEIMKMPPHIRVYMWAMDQLSAGEREAAEAAVELADKIDTMRWKVGTGATQFDDLAGQARNVKGDLEDVVPPTEETASALDWLADRAAAADQNVSDLATTLDQLAGATYGPEELRGAAAAAEQAVADAEAALAKYKDESTKATRKTDEYGRQVAILTGEIAGANREAFLAEIEMRKLGGLTMTEILDATQRWNVKLDRSTRLWRELQTLMGRVPSWTGSRPHGRGALITDEAQGGPVMPFGTYHVGEEGPETLVMGARGGFVIPGAAGHSGRGGGGGGSPVTIALQLDGRTVAEVVDRHLYYKAARAPQSPYAG